MKTHSVKPLAVVVLDGWGLGEPGEFNGVSIAETPNFDRLSTTYPFTQLNASGEAVGLPDGQIGNSEVGHTTIGAGCVKYQDLVRISKDAQEGKLGENPALSSAFDYVNSHASTLHIMGLFSPGGVHAHEDHFLEVINAALKKGVGKILLHPFTDGRDVSRTSAKNSLVRLEQHIDGIAEVEIATVMGRYFAMDRDNNWDRTDMAFRAIFEGKAAFVYDHTHRPSSEIEEWYSKEIFDELLEPQVFLKPDGTPHQVLEHDAIIFTNFRSDRAKQLSKKITQVLKEKKLLLVTMTHYDADVESVVAYAPEKVESTIGSVVAAAGKKQAHIAETEKFPHVTYYVNGGKTDPHAGEEHVLVPSRKDIKTHDQAPEMKAKEICDEAIKRLDSVDFLFINFANPDMVGHTANPQAIKVAIETVDTQLGRLTDAILQQGGGLIVIADHGNAERMWDPTTHEPHTAHTTNPVPCIVIHSTLHPKLRSTGGLKDIAPTALELMGLEVPPCMTGVSLIEE